MFPWGPVAGVLAFDHEGDASGCMKLKALRGDGRRATGEKRQLLVRSPIYPVPISERTVNTIIDFTTAGEVPCAAKICSFIDIELTAARAEGCSWKSKTEVCETPMFPILSGLTRTPRSAIDLNRDFSVQSAVSSLGLHLAAFDSSLSVPRPLLISIV